MPKYLERIRAWWSPTQSGDVSMAPDAMDLPLQLGNLAERREGAARVADGLRAEAQAADRLREGLMLPYGMGGGLDNDDYLYRRISDTKQQKRDLSPLAQDRMLEVTNYLWEQNCFGRRLVTLMADLILGEGVTVHATDERNQAVVDQTWNHRINQFNTNIRRFYWALSVTGELALPVMTNPISGIPTIGFLDPYQILRIETLPDNVLVPDVMVLKPSTGMGNDGQRLKIVREDPETGRLEGEVFYFPINGLPNSTRGRSDLLALADWLDLYDQYLFGEVERLHLLSSFVWDYKIDGAQDEKTIQDKLKKLPKFKPGTVWGHNEKESMEAVTPDLKAQDRSEVARMLRTHIAGSMGFPLSYLGETDSNKATIEGQNDVMMKTPAARQKEFARLIDHIVRFSLEHAQGANRSLFRDVQQGYKISMPEISAKDVARVGQILSSVMTAMDASLQNGTMSRRAAVTLQAALISHLGVELDPQEVMDEADQDAEDRQAMADTHAASTAAANWHLTLAALRGQGGGNPPIPGDGPPGPKKEATEVEADVLDEMRASIDALTDSVERVANRQTPAPNVDVHVAAPPAANVTVEAPQVHVTVPPAKGGTKTVNRDGNGLISSITTEGGE